MSKQSKEYWAAKKREQRAAKKRLGVSPQQARKADYILGAPEMAVKDLEGGAVEAGPGVEVEVGELGEVLPSPVLAGSTPAPPVEWDMGNKPDGVSKESWVECLERARRACQYAAMFPEHVRPSELCFQDPYWQWDNEVRKRVVA